MHLEHGNRARATDNSMVLSNVYLRLGDASKAREYLRGALVGITEMNDLARLPLILDLGMAMAVREGRPAEALRLGAAAAAGGAKMGGGTPNFVVSVDGMAGAGRGGWGREGAAG